jgi:hypothetical protein
MTRFIKSDKLKNEANKIFKGLIKTAYFEIRTINENESELPEYIVKMNEDSENYFNNFLDIEKQEQLRYDCETIVFEFNNGAIVEFSNSEWASMEIGNRKYLP